MDDRYERVRNAAAVASRSQHRTARCGRFITTALLVFLLAPLPAARADDGSALKLQSVGFNSEKGQSNNITIDFDRGGSLKDKKQGSIKTVSSPQWISPGDEYGENNMPIAYVRNTRMAAQVTFTVVGQIPKEKQPITIEGLVLGLGQNAFFEAKNVTITPGKPLTVTATGPALPNKTAHYPLNQLSINWSYITSDGASTPISSSSHELYVTLSKPLTSRVYLSVLSLAVGSGGADDEASAFGNVWNMFSNGAGPGNVTGWDGRPLFYYRNDANVDPIQGVVDGTIDGFADQTGGCQTVRGLLIRYNSSARCGVYGLLLRATLAVNGIASRRVSIHAIADETITRAGVPIGKPKLPLNMLVKNWQFAAAPTFPGPGPFKQKLELNCLSIKNLIGKPQCNPGNLPRGYPPPGFPDYDVMVPAQPKSKYGDLTSANTLPGQNTAPPSEKIFLDHDIVLYVPSGEKNAKAYCAANDCYFDPSYGATYRNEADFQTKSVDGFALPMPFPAEAPFMIHACKVGDANGNFTLSDVMVLWQGKWVHLITTVTFPASIITFTVL